MKGFNHQETIAYYEDIMKRAWAQVEAAETPEIKMEKFSENIEWTMLDRNYDDRTREVFQPGPVFIPTWWHRYDPTFQGRRELVGPIPSAKHVFRRRRWWINDANLTRISICCIDDPGRSKFL